MGTPAYLAPERDAGEPATPASDLYSLGIVAHECLAGTTPFHGTPLEVASASRFGSLPPLPAAVPAPVTALVTDLTAKDPAARPGSSAEVAARAAQLRDAMNGGLLAVPSGRPGTPPSARTTSHTAVLPDPQAPAREMLDWPSAAPQARSAPGRRPDRAGWVAGLAFVLVALAGWLLVSAVRGPAGGTADIPGGPHAGTTDLVHQRCHPGRPSGGCRAPAAG